MYWSGLKTGPAKPGRCKNLKNNMQRGEMGIVNGNPMGMGINIVGEWEWEWQWEWLYGNGREWESERHSRTPLVCIASVTVMLSSVMYCYQSITHCYCSLYGRPYVCSLYGTCVYSV